MEKLFFANSYFWISLLNEVNCHFGTSHGVQKGQILPGGRQAAHTGQKSSLNAIPI